MRLDLEQVLSLSADCHIALTEREAAALETELNDLLALTESLTEGNDATREGRLHIPHRMVQWAAGGIQRLRIRR